MSNKNQKQSFKKEPFSLMTVKTLLAILLFTGIGTIIIGGGYIVGEYSKTSNNQAPSNNKIWDIVHKCSEEHPEFCDRSCNVDSDCYPTCTHNMGCLRYEEGQVGASAIRCEVAPFSCKCENNKCEIVEYEYKTKILEPAKILGILYPLEIIEVVFYSDGGTTGVISKDTNNKDFIFCLDGRMQINEIGKELEPRYIYIGATYPTRPNAQKISIASEKEKAILYILQDWANKQVSKEEQIRLLNIRTVVGLSEEELKIYRILKIIKKLEDRNKIIDQFDASDWQTYRNEEFGFEIKYPEELIIEEFEYIYGKGLSINFTSGSILNYVVGPNFGVAGDKSVVVIDDQNYNMWCQTIEGGESCRILLDKGKEIDFKNLGSSDDFELFKKILSSFKFIEENETFDWQTYRNEEFGFEFDYFSEWKINVGKIMANEKGEQRQLISIDNLEILSGDAEISFNVRENVSLENVLQAEKSLNCYNVISGNEQKNECSFCSVNESNIVVAGYNGKKIAKISKEIKCKERGNCENLCIDYKIRTVIFQKDNNVYTLNTFGGEQSLKIFNQILSTFKFIEN